MFRKLAFFVCASLICAETRADFIIDVFDANIPVGGAGYVDVMIRSTSSNLLAMAGYEFAITGSTAFGTLQFRPSYNPSNPSNPANQTNSEQTATSPDYLFLGDTDASFFTAARQDPTKTSLVGGDLTASGNNATLTTTDRLLTRLELEHISPSPESAIGSSFTLSLINSGNTLFTNQDFAPVTIDSSSFTNSGTITMVATPEPSSLALMSLGAALFAWKRMRRHSSVPRD